MLIQLPNEDLSIHLLNPLGMLDLASSSTKLSNGGLTEWTKDLLELITEIHLKERQKLSSCGNHQGF